MTHKPLRLELAAELQVLRARLAEAEEALGAIRTGNVDAVRISGEHGAQIYTLSGADTAYRQLVETMSEGAATLSADGVILYCNHCLATMLELPHDQVMGSALRDYLPPADQKALAEILARAGTAPSHREVSLRSRQGRAVPAYLSASRLQSEGAETIFCLVLTDLTEQKRHADIASAERLARAILEQAAEAVVVCDEQGRVIRASQAARRFCDASPLQRPFAKAFPLRTAAADPFLLASVLEGETLRDVDVALDRHGKQLDLILNAGPLLSGKKILGCVVTLTDITERREAEETLRESEARYRTLAEASQDAIFIVGRDGRLQYINPAGARQLGRDAAELAGTAITDLFPPETIAAIRPALQKVFDSGHPYDDIAALAFPGGARWIESSLVGLVDATGCVTSVMGVGRDITERKQAEAALRASMEDFRTLAEAMPQIVWITRPDGWNVYFNQHWMDYTGLTLEESLGHGWNKPFHPEDQERAWNAWQKATTEVGIYSLEARLRRADGVYRWWLVRGVPLHDAAGNILKWYGTCTDIHDLKMAELKIVGTNQVLTESERRFSDLLESVELVSMMLDEDGQIAYCNDYLLRLTGWQREDVVGKDWFEMFVPPDRADVKGPFVAALLANQARAFHLEHEILTRSGERRLIRFNNMVLRSSAGAVIGTASIGEDITERTRAEEQRRRLELMVGAAPSTITVHDFEGRFLYVNQKTLDLHGYTREEFMALDLRALDVPASAELMAARMRELREHGEALFEVEHFRKDGTRLPLLVNVRLVPWGDQQAVLSVATDITDRKQAEAAVHLQSAALNAATNAMTITGRDGTMEWANPAFTTLTGYTLAEALGKDPLELLKSGAHDQAFHTHLWDTILAGDVWAGEMSNRRKDGSLYPEELTITPVKDDRGEIAHFISIKRDLTEHNEMEARFLQAQKMESVGQLAGGIAHDFNNLLTVMITTADLALGELKEGDPLHADFQEVRRAAERAAGLTRQLLAFSRRQLLQPEVLNLNAVVVHMQTMLRRLIRESIELVFAPARDLGSVRADPGQLEQVLLNLAVNARDAMPDFGTLTIETRNVELDEVYAAGHPSVKPGPHVMLAISDTGIGMSAATLQHIYEPFFTTKEVGRGTGLGLSTVYGIVKQSGGSISAYSELGKGTTFKVYLPRVEAEAQASQPALAVTSVHGTETVLIVEDDAALRHMAGRLLKSVGYTVLAAGDGTEALALLQGHDGPVQLMLTDVIMPGMGGRELATALQGLRPQMKVIFTSGYTDDVIRHKGLLNGAAHFIGKPYTGLQLRQKVREVLDS